MDTSTPYAINSRRRIMRTAPLDESVTTASSVQAGPSRLPDMTQLVDVNFSDAEVDLEDTENEDHATPRNPAASKLPPSNGENAAARLRAILSMENDLERNHPTPSQPPASPPPSEPTTDYESDFDRGESINATHNSIARESLRDVFSRAMRSPGGTPQKQKAGRDGAELSESESGSALSVKERSRIKGKRKTLSDEEVENSHRTPMPAHSSSGFKSRVQPLPMEVLQQRYLNGDASYGDDRNDSMQDASEVTASLLRELNSSPTSPPIATSTPQHSMQMSMDMNAQYQSQSNLLDQDSEMQRVINGLDSYDEQTGEHSESANGIAFPQGSESQVQETPRVPLTARKSTQSSPNDRTVAKSPHSPKNNFYPESAENKSSRQRVWSFPKGSRLKAKSDVTTGSGKTPLTARSLSTLSRKTHSPRVSEGSSRSSSVISNSDSQGVDPLYERERQWNKASPGLHRQGSSISLSSHSPHSAERPRTISASSRNDSPRSDSNSPSISRHVRRYNSLTSARSISPTGSTHTTYDDEPDPDLIHLRERNWNSPRPIWPSSERPESPSMHSTGSPSASSYNFKRARTRTTSVSSVDTDDSYNPPSYTSPTSSSRIRQSFGGTPSRLPRRHDSSPGQPPMSTSPSISPTLRRRGSTASLHSNTDDPGDSTRVRPTTISMSRLKLPSVSSLLTSPRKSPDNRMGKPTRIPVKSPRKVPPSAQARSDMFHPSDSNNEEETSGAAEEQAPLSSLQAHLQAHDELDIQELTPTLRTVPPPAGSPERSHLSSEYFEADAQGYRDAEGHGLNDSTSTVYAGPSRRETTTPDTPPRQYSSSSLKLEFTAPSPPAAELPDLPEPQSDDEDEWVSSRNVSPFKTDGKSVLKTPKAPGAWMDTPAPVRRQRSHSDAGKNELETPSNIPNWSTMQTPKPPGGWLATPVPEPPKRVYVDQSVETDTELDTDAEPLPALATNGLATPVSSLSKAFRYPQTPAAPGAWINTPASRKRGMNVRFDPDANETREFGNGESDISAAENLDESTTSQATQTMSPPLTPEIPGQLLSSPSKKPPTIRVLDAYGNEEVEEDKDAKEKSFRIVDALGETVKDEPTLPENDPSLALPSSRDELLSRMRRGLNELESDLHEVERASALTPSELSRVSELDAASRTAREKRRRLSSDVKKSNNEFKDRFGSLRASMQRSLSESATSANKEPFLSFGMRFFLLILLQLAVAIFMYRLLNSSAEELFLTTYYDPFQPDLHFITFKSKLRLSTSPEKYVSWLSFLDLLRKQGFRACVAQTRDNLSITLTNIQTYIWERWGEDGSYISVAWPPT